MSAKFWTNGNVRRERPERDNGRPRYRGHHRDERAAQLAAELQARFEFNQIARDQRRGQVVVRR